MLDARLLEAMTSGNVVVVVGTGMSAALSGGGADCHLARLPRGWSDSS
jgi:hypothetical protein